MWGLIFCPPLGHCGFVTDNRNQIIEKLKQLASLQEGIDAADAMKARLFDEAASLGFMHELGDLSVDFSRQNISAEAWQTLIDWGEMILPQRDAMLRGDKVNRSEDRPALHTHLRNPEKPMMQENLAAMAAVCEAVHGLGVSDVVVLGIGGSCLGAKTAVSALAPFQQGADIHFVSNLDPSHLDDILAFLNPVTTAFVAISKSFTTKEMLVNLSVAEAWLAGGGTVSKDRIAAVTARPQLARDRGIDEALILPMDEGVGGRFSLWSAAGLPIMLALGEGVFAELLAGAKVMDDHFATTPAAQNIPLLLALVRCWNRSFMGCGGLAIIPYDQRLDGLPKWVQQLEMESNGKPSDIATSPIVFGSAGSNAQHSFFQMIHQSNDIVPVEFIAPLTPLLIARGDDDAMKQHRDLVVQMIAQADSLACGDVSGKFEGGRPSVVMLWRHQSPFMLGQILALFEHTTVCLSFLNNLNSFDQPGVELGKTIAQRYDDYLRTGSNADMIPPISRYFLDGYQK